MCFRWGVVSVKPLRYKDLLVQVSPSLFDGVMEKSWKNKVWRRSLIIPFGIFPITVEFSMPGRFILSITLGLKSIHNNYQSFHSYYRIRILALSSY